jgi:hypothetical protein
MWPLERPWWIVVIQRIFCFIGSLAARILGRPPSLRCWLEAQPRIAASIIWQFAREVTDPSHSGEPTERAWHEWSEGEQAELEAEFESAWRWYVSQEATYSTDADDISYPPENQAGDSEFDDFLPEVYVRSSYAWALYVRWVALQLVVEMGRFVPWSVTDYDEEQLRALFDSKSFMKCLGPTLHEMGIGRPWNRRVVRRADNRGASLIAPPRYTLAFLKNNDHVGASRLETIGRFLQWASVHCEHFSGEFNYGVADEHWQYRGIPPITRILEGTTHPRLGFAHWTFGCHGTSGLIRNVLRAVNIPVHISVVCGHAHECFLTELLYLDHCDNPYSSRFRALGLPASALLVDHATYVSWVGSSTDNRDEGCDKRGEQINVLEGN